MKIFLIFGIILFLCFSIIASYNHEEYPLSRGEQLVNSTLEKTAKIIKKKHNIRPCGAGASMPGGPIRELTLCFDTKYPYSKEQLRDLLIKSAQDLLEEVNKNDEIQKFLKEKPFTIKNIQIIIYNHDKDGRSVMDPAISNAQIADGNLSYATIDPQDVFKDSVNFSHVCLNS